MQFVSCFVSFLIKNIDKDTANVRKKKINDAALQSDRFMRHTATTLKFDFFSDSLYAFSIEKYDDE